MRNIGIIGYKGSGKTTMAKFLVEKYNYHLDSFASPIKQICKMVFNLTDVQLYGDHKETYDERWSTTPRKLFQIVGTDLFRNSLPDYLENVSDQIWVRSLEDRIALIKDPIVIDDVRFINESEMLRRNDFIIIKIVRNSKLVIDSHISENDMYNIKPDYTICNDGSEKELYDTIDKIILTV